MGTRQPLDPRYETRVRKCFSRQQVLKMLGVSLTRIQPGVVELHMPNRDDLTQQHGYIHAGIVATVLDTACSYAASTLIPTHSSVSTVEYKINLLAPAKGDSLIVRANVKREGRTFIVCSADALVCESELLKPVATMLSTIMCSAERNGDG